MPGSRSKIFRTKSCRSSHNRWRTFYGLTPEINERAREECCKKKRLRAGVAWIAFGALRLIQKF